jgi:hypothetical protein
VLMLATDGANQPAIPSLMYLSIKASTSETHHRMQNMSV